MVIMNLRRKIKNLYIVLRNHLVLVLIIYHVLMIIHRMNFFYQNQKNVRCLQVLSCNDKISKLPSLGCLSSLRILESQKILLLNGFIEQMHDCLLPFKHALRNEKKFSFQTSFKKLKPLAQKPGIISISHSILQPSGES